MEWPGVDALGCLDVWVSGQVARAVDATPDCRNVKRSGIRRLSLTRDMRHGRVGVGGLCAAFREAATCVVCYVCCGLDNLISGWDGLQCASVNLVGRGQDRFVGRTSSNSSLQHVAVARQTPTSERKDGVEIIAGRCLWPMTRSAKVKELPE